MGAQPIDAAMANDALAEELDAEDDLRSFRSQFSVPNIYLCGNSLGPSCKKARDKLSFHVQKWASSAAEGHFNGREQWASIEDIPSELSMPIVGAKYPHEVTYMNSLTVNIHLLLTAFYRPVGKKRKIVIEEQAFSSDEYAIQTHLRTRGVNPDEAIVRLKPREKDRDYVLEDTEIISMVKTLAHSGELALIFLPGVQYYTGQVFPMEELCKAAVSAQVSIGFDLAHAVGNVPLQLHDWGADFAVWCSYKYLNGGPGAISGAFMHDRHADAKLNRFGGWWGHQRETRFEMGKKFIPQRGILGMQLSNVSVFSIAPVIGSLEVFRDAGGIQALRRKSIRLTSFLQYCLDHTVGSRVHIITPREEQRRGCQLSIKLRDLPPLLSMHDINNMLAENGVICDVREPNVLRVAPAPLFNSFSDVARFVDVLNNVLDDISRNRLQQ